MLLRKFITQFQNINHFVECKYNCTTQELASKLNVSRKRLLNYQKDLKEFVCNLDYSHELNSYRYYSNLKVV